MEDNEDGDDKDRKMDVNNDDNDNVLKAADDEDDDNDGAPPPPPPMAPPLAPVPLLLPAHFIVVVLANFVSAMGQFNIFIAIMNAVPFDHSPLAPVPSGAMQCGHCGIPCCEIEGSTDAQLMTEMHWIWDGARCKGEHKLSDIAFLVIDAVVNVLFHATCDMHVLHPGVQLWPGHGNIKTSFPDNCMPSLLCDVPCQNPHQV